MLLYRISSWTLHVQKNSGSTLKPYTQCLLASVFGHFNLGVSKIVNPSYSHSNFYKENDLILWFCFHSTAYHIKNAEIAPELHHDLISFSFDKLQDVFENHCSPIPDQFGYTFLIFIPNLLADLKQLVWYRFHSHMKLIYIL